MTVRILFFLANHPPHLLISSKVILKDFNLCLSSCWLVNYGLPLK